MPSWIIYLAFAITFILVSTAVFFFTLTRGALVLREAFGVQHDAAHIYPIYSNMWLIKLVDWQPVIAAILLFQYDKLVSVITRGLHDTNLHNKKVLITSCAFGNVIPRVVSAAIQSGASGVLIADIVRNELAHAEGKLKEFSGKLEFLDENATAMKQADGSVDANVIFFLLHELPHHLKGEALREAGRVLAPGGKLYLAEFHRPYPLLLRTLSWIYFKVFEPLGLALWSTHDPLKQLENMGGFSCVRNTIFLGNFQVIVATKKTV